MSVNQSSKHGLRPVAQAIRSANASAASRHSHIYRFECFDKHGNLKWVEEVPNLVVNEGLDDILDKYYLGSAYTAAHYVGLMDGAPTVAAGDTMASHAGWSEITAYDEANRPAFSPAAVTGQSTDNSASKASFTINADNTTLGGAFLSTDSTKGGTTGVLVGGAAFAAGNKLMDAGDVLNVTVTATAAAA